MAIRARLRRLERLAPARNKDPVNLPLEKNLAELKRIEKWLAEHGYQTAEEALKNGEKGPPEGWRWGSLEDIARIDKIGERLLQEAAAAIHKSPVHDIV
jgi:hypothetical protein